MNERQELNVPAFMSRERLRVKCQIFVEYRRIGEKSRWTFVDQFHWLAELTMNIMCIIFIGWRGNFILLWIRAFFAAHGYALWVGGHIWVK